MPSPGATPEVAAPPASSEAERELKFTLTEARAHIARRWLESTCRRDPEFPTAIVWTVYYDTPALAALGEKINSDFLKRKIRVRWYAGLNGVAAGPAFVEAKFRVGTQRAKIRERLSYSAEEVAGWDLEDPRLRSFPALLRDRGVLGQESWVPMLLIRYRRDRFVEPISRSRVSLDTDIAAAAVNSRFISVSDPSPLGTAVLEVKGASDRLPVALQSLLQIGAHKRSFSKFLGVYAHTTRQIL
ncbi:MAG: VTC domain-containing protein [Acidobacteria bacterium]|nr:MAG: VTC domain-containing protein [Acidobacteriota bacterium]